MKKQKRQTENNNGKLKTENGKRKTENRKRKTEKSPSPPFWPVCHKGRGSGGKQGSINKLTN